MKHKIKRTLPCAVEKWEKRATGRTRKIDNYCALCSMQCIMTNQRRSACMFVEICFYLDFFFFSGSCFIEFLQCQCHRMPSKNSRYLWFFYSHSILLFCSHKLLSLILVFFFSRVTPKWKIVSRHFFVRVLSSWKICTLNASDGQHIK